MTHFDGSFELIVIQSYNSCFEEWCAFLSEEFSAKLEMVAIVWIFCSFTFGYKWRLLLGDESVKY